MILPRPLAANMQLKCKNCGMELELSRSLPFCPDCIGREVGRIASFIASLNPDIPYSLLAFHPQFFMSDLPTTSRLQAEECLEAAKGAGLGCVRIGNAHLLRDY